MTTGSTKFWQAEIIQIMKTKICVLIFLLAAALAPAQTNNLTALLQQGLFEEQANRNLDAAIEDYAALARQFDKDRQLAATAVFRLGECYRAQGKTNQAAAQYQRVLRDFSDQQTLATLSRQDLTGMGYSLSGKTIVGTEPSNSLPVSAEASALASQISGIEQLKSDPEEQARAVIAFFPDDVLKNMMSQLAKLQAQVERVKANPQLTVRDLIVRDEDYSVVSFDGKLIRRTLFSSGTNLDLLANFQRESGTQLTWIKERVNFVLGIQKARLKVLLAAAGSETTPGVSQGKLNSAVTDEEVQEIRRIQQMIQNSPDLINAPGEGGNTPLTQSAYKGWLKVATYLIEHGADVNLGGMPALSAAAAAGNRAMVELLLSRGANVNSKDSHGKTALHIAAEKEFPTVAEVLLANKADVNAQDNSGNTPLFSAANNGSLKLVAMLLAAGANPNLPNKQGLTPLVLPAAHGSSEIVKALLAAGANPNVERDNGRTPLSYAVEGGSPETVKVLLAAKADPNGGKLDVPLLSAIYAKDAVSAELLLQAGANPNVAGQIDLPVRPNSADLMNHSGHLTPLWLTIYMKQLPMVNLLLKFKADPDDSQTDGRPLLFSALTDTNILAALLDAGANIESHDTMTGINGERPNWTPLAAAVWQQNAAAVDILLKHCANPNVRDAVGNVALHWNLSFLKVQLTDQNQKIVELLLGRGTDPNVRNNSGYTPLDWVKRRLGQNENAGDKAIAGNISNLLRQHGALDDLPNWDRIAVSRPAADFSTEIFRKGTNDWNHFTLLELICQAYHYNNWDGLLFFDLSRVVIARPGINGAVAKRIEINLLTATNSIDFTKDVPLEFGDVVEIPERSHTLAEKDNWYDGGLGQKLARHLEEQAGEIRLVVAGGQTIQLPLKNYVPAQSYVGYILKDNLARNVLTSSSDLSRVKVTRRDQKTQKLVEWVLDCSEHQRSINGNQTVTLNGLSSGTLTFANGNNTQSSSDLLLRDGDVVEVPQKR